MEKFMENGGELIPQEVLEAYSELGTLAQKFDTDINNVPNDQAARKVVEAAKSGAGPAVLSGAEQNALNVLRDRVKHLDSLGIGELPNSKE